MAATVAGKDKEIATLKRKVSVLEEALKEGLNNFREGVLKMARFVEHQPANFQAPNMIIVENQPANFQAPKMEGPAEHKLDNPKT